MVYNSNNGFLKIEFSRKKRTLFFISKFLFIELIIPQNYELFNRIQKSAPDNRSELSRANCYEHRSMIKHDSLRSLRHSSITYKLKLNGGDIKAVQGDSGHAQATMVTDQYSHILDEDRKANAELFENAFYSGKVMAAEEPEAVETEPAAAVPAGVDPELLMKLLTNPEMAALLKTLAQTIK